MLRASEVCSDRPRKNVVIFLVALGFVALLSTAANAATFRVSGGIGVTNYDETPEIQFNAGVGVFPVNGLLVHADIFGRFPDGGTIWRISPGVTYFIPLTPILKPYIGAFYGRYIATGNLVPAIRNSVGARAGLQVSTGTPLSLVAGVVYERYFHDSNTPSGFDKSRWYPEVSIAVSF